MNKLFLDLPEALENNYNLPLRCSFRPISSKPILPNISSEKSGNADKALALYSEEKTNKIKANFNLAPKIILGTVSGLISSAMGIGGAVMNVPVLRYFGYPINKAIGSAAAIGFIVALFAVIGFLFSGSYLSANLPLSIGFINIPAFLIFVPITTIMAKVGANTTHKVNKSKLQRMFGIFLYIVGTIFLYRYLNI